MGILWTKGSLAVATILLAGFAVVVAAVSTSAPVTFDTVTIPVFVACFTALVTYAGLRFRMSGRISTSDASDLWRESQAMRQELRQEVVRQRALIDELQQQLDQHEQRLADCQRDLLRHRGRRDPDA